jgi:hypothetical protein
MARVVVPGKWIDGGRYERFQHLEVFKKELSRIQLKGFSFTAGGLAVPLGSSKYNLVIDGNNVSETVPGTPFVVDFTSFNEGWHKVEVTGLAEGETSPVWWVYILDSAVARLQPFIPVVKGTYEIVNGSPVSAFALADSSLRPKALPIAKRNPVPFDIPLNRSSLTATQLVPVRSGDLHRPCLSANGIVSSFDKQNYFWDQMVSKLPSVALLDGPRGVGTVAMVTHAEVGSSTNADGSIVGNIYFCDPWRMGRVSPTGTVTTLVGFRHKGMPGQWQDVSSMERANLELVGDWSSIPVERRGLHELWGMSWDERTLVVDDEAEPIASDGNRKPHKFGPVAFLSDTQNNRILKVEFNPTSHTAPAKVTEFITDLGDPWDVVCDNGILYVSQRGNHKISSYDATTGAFIKDICSGANLASVDRNRFVRRLAADVVIQAQACVAPEGLYKLKGDDWLYFGSFAMKQVKRVNLLTGAIEVMCNVPVDGNSQFIKLAVSDGSFGPKGTIFTWSWSNSQFGYPFTWLPSDGPKFVRWSGPSQHWSWYEQEGGSGIWNQFAYGTAGGVGKGFLVCGGAGEGLQLISQKQVGDLSQTAGTIRGAKEYKDKSLHLLHGHNGYGYYGLPLPWGESQDLDDYLTLCGHKKE